MLSEEMAEEDRGFVRKAIELHKLGVNRKKLEEVRVVGVTCASCVFPFLQNNVFQVQLQVCLSAENFNPPKIMSLEIFCRLKFKIYPVPSNHIKIMSNSC